MPKPTKGPRLGGGPAHEKLMLANLATALFTHGRIQTTETKAKRLRPYAERLVTFAKRGDLHARRRVMTVIRDKSAVHKLFTEIAPLVEHREGGYTRIVKTGFRKGDNAPMAVIELILDPVEKKPSAKKAKKAAEAEAVPAAAVEADAEVTEEVSVDAPAADEATESVTVDVDDAVGTTESDAPVEDAAAEEAPAEEAPVEDAASDEAAPEDTPSDEASDEEPADGDKKA